MNRALSTSLGIYLLEGIREIDKDDPCMDMALECFIPDDMLIDEEIEEDSEDEYD